MHYPLTWSNGFYGGRGKKGGLVEKVKGPWQQPCLLKIQGKNKRKQDDKRNEAKKRQNNGQSWISSKNYPFWTYITKTTQSLFGARSFLLIHIQFRPSEGPKCIVNWYLKKSDHGNWIIKSDHGKKPSSMVQLHGPWCKPTLNVRGDFWA